ncbi:hypothetical protein ACFOMD_02695 [Sphingoaurantiacus capsulatus]|uniref:Secreted protein n=1 Tax=Sphingoaurantiacus capsulatus TaxID=1771310 RepID=A0ABV7X6K7_9SPHN
MRSSITVVVALCVAGLGPVAIAAEPVTTAAAAPLNDNEIICRKTLETGSLVRKTKQCFTRAEWDKIAAANRQGNQKTADQLSGGHNCQATGTC